MKHTLPQEIVARFTDMAINGEGRERSVGGGNTLVEMTMFMCELPDAYKALGGGTIRITLNKHRYPIGYRVFPPKQREL